MSINGFCLYVNTVMFSITNFSYLHVCVEMYLWNYLDAYFNIDIDNIIIFTVLSKVVLTINILY